MRLDPLNLRRKALRPRALDAGFLSVRYWQELVAPPVTLSYLWAQVHGQRAGELRLLQGMLHRVPRLLKATTPPARTLGVSRMAKVFALRPAQAQALHCEAD